MNGQRFCPTERGAAEAGTMHDDYRRTAVDLFAGLDAAQVSAFAITIDRMLRRVRGEGPDRAASGAIASA